MINAAKLVNILENEDTSYFPYEQLKFANEFVRLEIKRICGIKTNDLSLVLYYEKNYLPDAVNDEYICKLLTDVCADEPYVEFYIPFSSFMSLDVHKNKILFLSEKIGKMITVRLINGFDGNFIKKLSGNVKFEFDISNEHTAEYMRFLFGLPFGKKRRNAVWNTLTALLDEKLAAPTDLIEFIDTVKCPDILYRLFKYNDNTNEVKT